MISLNEVSSESVGLVECTLSSNFPHFHADHLVSLVEYALLPISPYDPTCQTSLGRVLVVVRGLLLHSMHSPSPCTLHSPVPSIDLLIDALHSSTLL